MKDLRNTGKCTTTSRGAWKRQRRTGQVKKCGETEENLRMNNSERAYQLVKDLTTCETRESYYYPRLLGKMPQGWTWDTKPMDKIVLWGVQSQDQWRSISTELSPDRHRGRRSHPSQRSGSCSTITEEREVNWSRQHPGRTGPSRWRGCNHRSHTPCNTIW